MKIFLSWSGNRSRRLAEIYRSWLPVVIQAVKPYFTPDDIAKGSRWHGEISKELEVSKLALIFLTSENTESSWILFEAGALSKQLDKALVCPICFGIAPAQLKGPLSHFQAAIFDESETWKLLVTLNDNLGQNSLRDDVLKAAFNKWWPDLKERVENALKEDSNSDLRDSLSDRELLEEILHISRESLMCDRRGISAAEIQKLIWAYHDLIDHIVDYDIDNTMKNILFTMNIYLDKLVADTANDKNLKATLDSCLVLVNQKQIKEEE